MQEGAGQRDTGFHLHGHPCFVVRQVLAESSRYIIMSSLGNIKNALFVSETPELELPLPLASVQESR